MHCRRIDLPNGGFAIVCSARPPRLRCTRCGQPAEFQCDWNVGGGKICDRPTCARCALEVAPEKHLCPEHQVAYRQRLKEAAAAIAKARAEHEAAAAIAKAREGSPA